MSIVFLIIPIFFGLIITALRKRFNWRKSVHWIFPVGFPVAGTVLLTVNSFFTKYDDSQWAFGVAAILMAMVPVGALYGVTVWIAERSGRKV